MQNQRILYKSTRILAFSALLIALDIIFTRFLRIEIFGYERYSLQFLSHALSGLLMGPVIAAVNCMAGDLLGMLINSGGLSLFLPVTLNCALRGLIYGFLLHRKHVSFVRTLIAVAAVTVCCDLFANSYILHEFYELSFWGMLLAKLPFRLVSIPIYAGVLWFTWSRLETTHVFDILMVSRKK